MTGATAGPSLPAPRLYQRFFWLLSAAWLLIVGGSLAWNLALSANEHRTLAFNAARALLEKDLMYRQWSLLHGGVYIVNTNPAPPSASDRGGKRDVVTRDGQRLTLLNPAEVSRQIFELQGRATGVRGRLTSLKPIRPENAPDPWERQALEAFAAGRAEVSGIVGIGDKRYLRLMRPLVTVPICLRCHEEAGRQPGEIRGGISVSVPLDAAVARREGLHLAMAHGALWLVGMAGLVLGTRRLHRHSQRRSQAEQALLATKEALAHANAGLEQKVRERTARLEEAVADLEQFSYTLTHDMRAPLRAMQGLCTLLSEECGACLDAKRQDYLRRISEAAGRMDRLITDSLQYTRAMGGHFGLEPVDPGALLRGMLESYPQFQPPHAIIRIEGPLPIVHGNPAGMTQCFSNLLGNAVKFVHPGQTPRVRIWAEKVTRQREFMGRTAAGPEGNPRRQDLPFLPDPDPRSASAPAGAPASAAEYVRFWFEDQGIGIEKKYHAQIWEMFHRLDKRYEGTGVGLALVRKVVERMGGRVGVESEPGHGSRFWVELQLASPDARPLGTELLWALQPAEKTPKP